MKRRDYAWGMSATPSDPHYINTKALEGFMRAFDKALTGKYDLSGGVMTPVPPQQQQTVSNPRPTATRYREGPPVSFWHSFSFVKAIIRFRDNMRLRKYNREWIKNNIGDTHA